MIQPVSIERRRIEVRGQVQGVGFRPWVFRVASGLGLIGEVRNDSKGARIEVQGPPEDLESFLQQIQHDLPPLADVVQMTCRRIASVDGERGFRIAGSCSGGSPDAQVTADTAICADCLRELRSEKDPRHGHAFITCTNCGPRYSIIQRVPYDRPNTTMAPFEMCPRCAEEYADPRNRRFHAQPIACPQCGPRMKLIDPSGREIPCQDPIAKAAEMLRAGGILAIKGLGGYHLACRGDDETVVRRLRLRKHREAKPLALMVADLDQASRLCLLPPEARRLLAGPERPIVLLPRLCGAPIADSVAEGLDTLGIMLPCTPLEYLLFDSGLGPLVMTSGNVSGAPLVKDDYAAVAELGSMVDALLTHNRDIESRVDDSVVRFDGRGASFLRRARGYAPRALSLGITPRNVVPILAVGAELKSTFCLLRNDEAILSPHIGDLTEGSAFEHFLSSVDRLESLFGFDPGVLACDAHPGYLSTEYARARSRGDGLLSAAPLVRVQHHHAHIAACLAEHGCAGPALGLACDGIGYGEDGSGWGCEVLRADLASFERLGSLRPLPLPGADAAARETCRPALGAVWEAMGPLEAARLAGRGVLRVDRARLDPALEMLSHGVCCPRVSSLGRWFDVAAHLVGVADANRYEGEAPMRLETLARGEEAQAYPFTLRPGAPFRVDLRPMVRALVRDVLGGAERRTVAARFHQTAVAFLLAMARRSREQTGLETIALSGGCFANQYLTDRLSSALEAEGFEVLQHRRVPCNDGGVSLGQAVVAAARLGAGLRGAEMGHSHQRRGEHVCCRSIED
jgi:hydrogenase maturation protein HypF